MHGRLARAALVTLLVLLVSAASASASDDFASPKPLFLGTEDATVDNTAGTVQPGETLTTASTACPVDLSEASRTMWWYVVGTGRPLTITTGGSPFDTHLGIFQGAIDGAADCQDGSPTETITMAPSRPDRTASRSAAAGEPGPRVPGRRQRRDPREGHVAAAAQRRARRRDAAGRPGRPIAGDNYASGEELGEVVVLQPPALRAHRLVPVHRPERRRRALHGHRRQPVARGVQRRPVSGSAATRPPAATRASRWRRCRGATCGCRSAASARTPASSATRSRARSRSGRRSARAPTTTGTAPRTTATAARRRQRPARREGHPAQRRRRGLQRPRRRLPADQHAHQGRRQVPRALRDG